MLAEWGTMSLEQVLAPSIEMAYGYPIEASAANGMNRAADQVKQWPYTRDVYLPHLGEEREGPVPGEIFRQEDLRQTLVKLVEAEKKALAVGKTRKEAIYAAYDRFYRGDIAEEIVRGTQEQGGLITMEDLDTWKVHIEEPVMTTYKGIEVYKLTTWVQGPVMLQALNLLEQIDLQSMGLNSAQYIHAVYQSMNHAYADRDFYYGDPYFPPEEPIAGLLSKDYATERLKGFNWERNDPGVGPGDPYPFQGGQNPFAHYLDSRNGDRQQDEEEWDEERQAAWEKEFYAGTTAVQTADKEGWIVSMTPSGGWITAVIAGRTGIGLSQRAQAFVLDPRENPYNVVEPGKRPRATLTPSLALKDGKPFLSFSLQGGDGQDQNLLQMFLNIVEWDMNVQQAAEGPNIGSGQMHSSFGTHTYAPGRLTVHSSVPSEVVRQLESMGYTVRVQPRTSGPLTGIFFDWKNGTMWGGASNNGDDYGIAW